MSLIDGIGPVIAGTFADYFSSGKNQAALDDLLGELTIEIPAAETGPGLLEGKTFVITGSLEHYANRNEMKAVIEEQGGKVTGSVSRKDGLPDQQRRFLRFLQKPEGQRAGNTGDYRRRISVHGSEG